MLTVLTTLALLAPGGICGDGRIDRRMSGPGCPECPPCGIPGRPCPPCDCSPPRPSEVCDRRNLDGESCARIGYRGGKLRCAPDCLAFDTSGCVICRSGDGVRCLSTATPAGASPVDTRLLGAVSGGRGLLVWWHQGRRGHTEFTAPAIARVDAAGRVEPAITLPTPPGVGRGWDRLAPPMAIVPTARGWLLAVGDTSAGRGGGSSVLIHAIPHDGEVPPPRQIHGIGFPTILPLATDRWLIVNHWPWRGHSRRPEVIDATGAAAPLADGVAHAFTELDHAIAAADGDTLAVAWHGRGGTSYREEGIWAIWRGDALVDHGRATGALTVPLADGRALVIDREAAHHRAPGGESTPFAPDAPPPGAVLGAAVGSPVALPLGERTLYAALLRPRDTVLLTLAWGPPGRGTTSPGGR
ncbi:MAG: hypothetical protein R3F65_28205 [bacterium]